MPFTAPGAHARMVLPLQRELDPEGLGRSENRCFFDVFSESKKKGIRGHPFLTFSDFIRPEGTFRLQNHSQMVPPREGIDVPFTGVDRKVSPDGIWFHFWAHLGAIVDVF